MQNGQNCVLFVFRPDERGSEWATARGQGSIMRQRKMYSVSEDTEWKCS